jgi:hypothetical protein
MRKSDKEFTKYPPNGEYTADCEGDVEEDMHEWGRQYRALDRRNGTHMYITRLVSAVSLRKRAFVECLFYTKHISS